ncbi:MAG: sigma-70 family RNA polymerase sigma factor [Pirellulaceae bacterium]
MDRANSADKHGVDPALLVEKYQAGVWRYLRTLGASPDLADDLTQGTFLAVLRSNFVHEAWPKTWSFLRRVAFNLYVDEHRRRGRLEVVELIEERDLAWSNWFGDEGMDAEMLDALKACVQKLSPRAQWGLELRYRDQLSREQIASTLNMSPDGAKNLLQRAKHRLRECLKRKFDE